MGHDRLHPGEREQHEHTDDLDGVLCTAPIAVAADRTSSPTPGGGSSSTF